MLPIRDFYPGSEFFHPGSRIRIFSIPDPWSSLKKFFLIQKLFKSSRKYDPRCSSRIRILIFYPSRILDPGVKKAPNPGSGSATLVKSVIYHPRAERRSGSRLPKLFRPKSTIFRVLIELQNFQALRDVGFFQQEFFAFLIWLWPSRIPNWIRIRNTTSICYILYSWLIIQAQTSDPASKMSRNITFLKENARALSRYIFDWTGNLPGCCVMIYLRTIAGSKTVS